MGASLQAPNPNIEVRKAHGDDVTDLAPHLRQDDLDEIADLSGRPPVDVLGQAFVESSRCYTVLYRGRIAAMMGVVDAPDNGDDLKLGIVWLLGSDDVAIFGFSLTKWTRTWLLELCQGYDLIGNIVSANNVVHERWLRRIGARVIGSESDYGPGKVEVLKFIFTLEDLRDEK